MSNVSSKSGGRIAVVGATGRIGSALLSQLVNDDVELVAFSRNASTDRLPRGLTPTVVDFEAPASLAQGLQGVHKLFISHGTYAKQVQNEIALIDAAVAAGVKHIVKVSVMGPPVKLHPFDWHMQIEAHLATYDVGYTVLRPSTFVDGLDRAVGAIAEGSWGGSAGEGRANLVDTRDIADVGRIALLDDKFIDAQRAYHLTGPASVSMTEVAAEFSRQLGREVRYLHRSRTEQRELLTRAGASELAIEMRLGLDLLFEQSAQAETTSTVSDFTGKAPRSVATWISDNLSLFAPAAKA
jgi:uncharacterized protein YbjT (DUF2867 family)